MTKGGKSPTVIDASTGALLPWAPVPPRRAPVAGGRVEALAVGGSSVCGAGELRQDRHAEAESAARLDAVA
jgi:hypothetical protein